MWHSWPFPPLWNTFFTWLLRDLTILIFLIHWLLFCGFLLIPSTIKQWSAQDSFPGPLSFSVYTHSLDDLIQFHALNTISPLVGPGFIHSSPELSFDLYTHLFNFTQHPSVSVYVPQILHVKNWILELNYSSHSKWQLPVLGLNIWNHFVFFFFLSHPTSNVSASPVGSTFKIRVRLWPHLAPHPACCQLRGHRPRSWIIGASLLAPPVIALVAESVVSTQQPEWSFSNIS